jgi:ubiquinone biosynthesis protein UbiJ
VPAAQDTAALAERLGHLRDQAEQLARELETLEKETQKKK